MGTDARKKCHASQSTHPISNSRPLRPHRVDVPSSRVIAVGDRKGSNLREAAVDEEFGPVDEAAIVGGEEDDGLRHLV